MIIRILGAGQFEVPKEAMQELNSLDDSLVSAIEAKDEAAFQACLVNLLSAVRVRSRQLPEDYLGPSDLVLPDSDVSLEEVGKLLTDEGLIPD